MLDVVLSISVLLPDPADTDSATAELRRIKVTIRLRVLNIDLLTAFIVVTAASFRSSSLRLTASFRCH